MLNINCYILVIWVKVFFFFFRTGRFVNFEIVEFVLNWKEKIREVVGG